MQDKFHMLELLVGLIKWGFLYLFLEMAHFAVALRIWLIKFPIWEPWSQLNVMQLAAKSAS